MLFLMRIKKTSTGSYGGGSKCQREEPPTTILKSYPPQVMSFLQKSSLIKQLINSLFTQKELCSKQGCPLLLSLLTSFLLSISGDRFEWTLLNKKCFSFISCFYHVKHLTHCLFKHNASQSFVLPRLK